MSKKNTLRPAESLNPFETHASEKLVRADRICLLVLTLLYGLIALLNLGTLNFPESVYYGDTGDTFTLTFDAPVTLAEAWCNGNIATGSLTFTNEEGESWTYTQDQGDMFKWHKETVDLPVSDTLTVEAEGEVAVNEIAFFDEAGNLLPVTASAEGADLVDEQSTVPDRPGYYNGMIFDEIYHARTAYEHIHNMSVYEWTHPPLGKLIIALGILIFGMNPFGWRIMGTLFGIAMVPILYVFAKRMLRRTDYALLAAGLWAFDCMHFTQTRIATIDVYGVFFILLMFLFMYEYIRRPYLTTPLKEKFRYLALSGLSFGLGVASKWIGCYAGAGLAVLFFGHVLAALYRTLRLEPGEKKQAQLKRFWNVTWKTVLWCCLFFLALPGGIYFASYIPYYRYEGDTSLKEAWDTLLYYQKIMYNYHSKLTATHMCQSAWYQWPFTAKSVWFFVSGGNGWISNISSTGNPAVWWVSSVGAVCLLLEWVMGRLKKDSALPVLLVGVLANYLPWVLVSRCALYPAGNGLPSLPSGAAEQPPAHGQVGVAGAGRCVFPVDVPRHFRAAYPHVVRQLSGKRAAYGLSVLRLGITPASLDFLQKEGGAHAGSGHQLWTQRLIRLSRGGGGGYFPRSGGL